MCHKANVVEKMPGSSKEQRKAVLDEGLAHAVRAATPRPDLCTSSRALLNAIHG